MRWMSGMAAALLLAACGSGGGGASCPQAAGDICLVAGTGVRGFNADGLPADKTELDDPTSVGPGPDGRTYIVDLGNLRVARVDKAGLVHTIIGNGRHRSAVTDDPSVPAVDSPMDEPVDFDFDATGHFIYVGESDTRVVKLANGYLHLVAGTGDHTDTGDGGPAKQAAFVKLDGIAIAKDGSIYVADSGANRVRVITPDGIIHAFAGTGQPGEGGDGGPAVNAEVTAPMAVAVGPDGGVYIAEGNEIRKVDPAGMISTVAGNGNNGFAGDGGPATKAELAVPDGVAVAPDGTLYISDGDNNRIRKVDTNGIITTIAGTGKQGLVGDGGLAVDATLGGPARLKLSGNALYFGDADDNCARVIYLP